MDTQKTLLQSELKRDELSSGLMSGIDKYKAMLNKLYPTSTSTPYPEVAFNFRPSCLRPISLDDNPVNNHIVVNFDKARIEREQERLNQIRRGIPPEGIKRIFAEFDTIINDNSYDDEYKKPTDYSVRMMAVILLQSVVGLEIHYPVGDLYADGTGGLRIDWRNGEKQVRLVVPANEDRNIYIYYQNKEDFNGCYDVSGQLLKKFLGWLIDEENLPSFERR